MDILSFFTIFFLCLLTKPSSAMNCQPLKCDVNSPEIKHPFQIKTIHQNHSDFNIFCKNNKTVMNFPNYGDLIVKSISYDTKRLKLIDPKSCVHEVFLNLNLDSSSFSYYYILKEYKYVNCSSKVASFVQVPCLSGSDFFVYILEPDFQVPISCNTVKTVEIPFSYSPYLSDNSFGLQLTWDSTVHKYKETGETEKHFKVIFVPVFIFVAGILFFTTTKRRFNKESEAEKSKNVSGSVDVEKLMWYEALVPAATDYSHEICFCQYLLCFLECVGQLFGLC